MKLALAPRPDHRDVFALAAVELGRYAARRAAGIPRARNSPDEFEDRGCRNQGRLTTQLAIGAYLAVTVLNVRQASAARALGYHRETVRQMLSGVEDRRDEPQFDAALEAASQEMLAA